jgi:hypothetical protein
VDILLYMIAAFGGGVFGAAVGGLIAFSLMGVAAALGIIVVVAGGSPDLVNTLAWGPFLGPHISFAGAAAAAAYAMKRGKLSTGRDITTGLMGLNSPDVLLVGGIFGVFGYLLNWALVQIGASQWVMTIALAIVLHAMVARLLFGKTGLFGTVPAGYNRWLPTEKGSWIPWQSEPLQLLVIGAGYGALCAYVMNLLGPNALYICFAFSTISLFFLEFGIKIPVTHHISLPAEMITIGALAAGASPLTAILWGITFGLAGAYLGEFFACTFTSYGDSHIDPPASAITLLTVVQPILLVLGLLTLSPVVVAIILIVVAAAGYFGMGALRGGKVALAPV